MGYAEGFLYSPVLGGERYAGDSCFPELGQFQSSFASSCSENRETALVMHSSIPNPQKTLSGCNFLCEKKSAVVAGLPFAIL